jgi:ABC-2 type transport system permease protein
MGRYLKLYLYFLRFSFSRAMEFRLDFFFRIAMDAIFYVIQIMFFSVLYSHTSLLGGWTYDQALIFVCGYFLIDSLHMTIFANNLWWFPIFVNKGDLDYYLVRPISSLFFLSLRDFAANSFLNVIIAVGLVVWSISIFESAIGLDHILWYGLLLINGTLLYYTIHMCFLIPVFWLHSNRGMGEIFFSVSKYAERPDRIYTGYLRRVLISFLPFALIASFPARALFEGVDFFLLMHIFSVTVLVFLFMVWLWRLGLRSYSSASS